MIEEKEFRNLFGKKLNKLRKNSGMTQSELAEKLNYTDKAVSKWERGESVPDSYTIYKIGELFSVKMDDLFSEKECTDNKSAGNKEPLIERVRPNQVFIPLISTIGVFIIASVLYVIMINFPLLSSYAYLSFLYSVPIASIVLIVFSSMWWKIKYKCMCVSALIWSLGFAIYFTFNNENLRFIFVTCAIMQVVCIMVYVFVYLLRRHNANSANVEQTQKENEITEE